MSKSIVLAFVVGSFGILAACTPPEDRYPVSGEECGPQDPVKDVDPADLNCVPSA